MVFLCGNGCACVDDDDIEYANYSTCHGMKRFCNTWQSWRRAFWLFVTCLSVCLLGQQLLDRFHNFIKFELKTEISVETAKSLPLPTVTLCNLNMFSKSLLTPMDVELLANVSAALSKSVNQRYLTSFTSDDLIANWSAEAYWRSVHKFEQTEENILAKYGETSFSVDKWIKRAGWQIHRPGHNTSALLSCRVGKMTCSVKDFRQIYTPQGLCYSLNWKESPRLYQKMPGGEAGINILLDINQDEYTHYNLNGDSQYECGSKVVISDWYDYVDLGLAVGMSPGFLSYVSTRQIRRTTINHRPWGVCESGRTTSGLPYSTRQCHAQCAARHSIKACGCRLWYEPILNGVNVSVCGVARTTGCLILKSLPEEEDVEEECIKSCSEACETTSYSIAASYTLMTSNNTIAAFVDYLRSLTGLVFTEAQVLRNIIAVQVAYPELFVETMSSTQAQTISAFLGDLGGQLGLFAGISLITVIELLEYPFLKIGLLFRKYRRTRRTHFSANKVSTVMFGAKRNRSMSIPSVTHPQQANSETAVVTLNSRRKINVGTAYKIVQNNNVSLFELSDCDDNK